MIQELFFDTLKLGAQGLEHLDNHIKRTELTCNFLHVQPKIAMQTVKEWYVALNRSLIGQQHKRVRIGFNIFNQKLRVDVVISAQPDCSRSLQLGICSKPILQSHNNNFHYKLTANPVRQVEVGPYYDLILFNEQGYVGETSKAALYYQLDQQLYTAPTEVGILHSTSREVILKSNHVNQRLLHIDEINLVEQWYISNAIIGFCPVTVEIN